MPLPEQTDGGTGGNPKKTVLRLHHHPALPSLALALLRKGASRSCLFGLGGAGVTQDLACGGCSLAAGLAAVLSHSPGPSG